MDGNDKDKGKDKDKTYYDQRQLCLHRDQLYFQGNPSKCAPCTVKIKTSTRQVYNRQDKMR